MGDHSHARHRVFVPNCVPAETQQLRVRYNVQQRTTSTPRPTCLARQWVRGPGESQWTLGPLEANEAKPECSVQVKHTASSPTNSDSSFWSMENSPPRPKFGLLCNLHIWMPPTSRGCSITGICHLGLQDKTTVDQLLNTYHVPGI